MYFKKYGMQNQDDIFKQIQKMFAENPQSFNIIEEEIDIEIQMAYLKRSKMLQKQKKKLEDVLKKAPQLFDAEVRFEEKRDILIFLASFEEVEAFRAIESYWKVAEGEMKSWASMAYRESKMILESSLLDEKQILISTGLGGKGYKLRFFIVLVHKEKQVFSESQQKLISNEIEYAVQNADGEMETVEFEKDLSKITSLIPLNVSIKNTVRNAIQECNQYGDFLSDDFIITNIKKLDSEEIYTIIENRNDEKFLNEIDFDSFDEDFDDYDEDDEE